MGSTIEYKGHSNGNWRRSNTSSLLKLIKKSMGIVTMAKLMIEGKTFQLIRGRGDVSRCKDADPPGNNCKIEKG